MGLLRVRCRGKSCFTFVKLAAGDTQINLNLRQKVYFQDATFSVRIITRSEEIQHGNWKKIDIGISESLVGKEICVPKCVPEGRLTVLSKH